jgi:hypothetical protein
MGMAGQPAACRCSTVAELQIHLHACMGLQGGSARATAGGPLRQASVFMDIYHLNDSAAEAQIDYYAECASCSMYVHSGQYWLVALV